MRIIDTSDRMLSAFRAGRFDPEKWAAYIDRSVPGAKELCLDDMRECLAAGFSWEKDFLPVLNAVWHEEARRERAIRSFHRVTEDLEETLVRKFYHSPDADLILYLGLCSGAGWVTEVRGKECVLFGIEKILELGWYDRDAMTGLVLHELGHVYQAQFGVLHRETDSLPDRFLWQLFTEGIAMVFEQEIVGDPGYFHQDRGGWLLWCRRNADTIRRSFCADLDRMTEQNQRYFGDWVRFEGKGDVGYFLGAVFVRFLMESVPFDRLISFDVGEVREGFERFKDVKL